MVQGAALPREVISEIRAEVGAQLHQKLEGMLDGRGAGLDAPAYADLVQQIINSSDVKQEVEPLVTLLVTYASNRLNTMG